LSKVATDAAQLNNGMAGTRGALHGVLSR